MAYDEGLADRIRAIVGAGPGSTEQRMFGGLAFLVDGNMAVTTSGEHGLMVRVDPAQSDELVATTTARPVEMRGRPMRGWLHLDSEHIRSDHELESWVGLGLARARSLPPKQ